MLRPILDSDVALVGGGWRENSSLPTGHPGTIWADLRTSEAQELREAVGEVVEAAERAMVGAIIEGVTEAAGRFAEAHPDIPRGLYGLPPQVDEAPAPRLGKFEP